MADTAPPADIAAATEPKNRFSTVTLTSPITRGEMTIVEIQIRKPLSGQLRNLSLKDILITDVTTMLKLIPRVCEPRITEDEADALEPEDFAEIAGTIRGFFMTKAEHQAVEMMIAEHRPTT